MTETGVADRLREAAEQMEELLYSAADRIDELENHNETLRLALTPGCGYDPQQAMATPEMLRRVAAIYAKSDRGFDLEHARVLRSVADEIDELNGLLREALAMGGIGSEGGDLGDRIAAALNKETSPTTSSKADLLPLSTAPESQTPDSHRMETKPSEPNGWSAQACKLARGRAVREPEHERPQHGESGLPEHARLAALALRQPLQGLGLEIGSKGNADISPTPEKNGVAQNRVPQVGQVF